VLELALSGTPAWRSLRKVQSRAVGVLLTRDRVLLALPITGSCAEVPEIVAPDALLQFENLEDGRAETRMSVPQRCWDAESRAAFSARIEG
jgi:hypothetical protein